MKENDEQSGLFGLYLKGRIVVAVLGTIVVLVSLMRRLLQKNQA